MYYPGITPCLEHHMKLVWLLRIMQTPRMQLPIHFHVHIRIRNSCNHKIAGLKTECFCGRPRRTLAHRNENVRAASQSSVARARGANVRATILFHMSRASPVHTGGRTIGSTSFACAFIPQTECIGPGLMGYNKRTHTHEPVPNYVEYNECLRRLHSTCI